MPTTLRGSFVETARRTQMVDAAIAILASNGSRGLTFARLAEAVGVSPGLITYHFGTKDELLAAVQAKLDEGLDTAMAHRSGAATTYVEALYLMVVGFVEHCAEHPREMMAHRHLTQARDQAVLSARDHAAAALPPVRGLAELEAMIREGQDEGEFAAACDPRTLATILLAGMATAPAEVAGRSRPEASAYAHDLSLLLVHAVADTDNARVRRQLRSLRRQPR